MPYRGLCRHEAGDEGLSGKESRAEPGHAPDRPAWPPANGIAESTGLVEHRAFNGRVPRLLVWAEYDLRFPPSAALRLHRNITGTLRRVIPNCGPFLQEATPDEVNRHLLVFPSRRTA